MNLALKKLNLLEKEVANLHAKIGRLEALIEFHNGPVPLKYRKAFPDESEDPYLKHKPFPPAYPKVFELGKMYHGYEEIEMPTDPKEYEKAKERMGLLHKQSLEIPNPNLLSEILKNEHDPSLISFKERWPTIADFPIYKYNKTLNKLERIETYSDLGIMPKQNSIDPEIYWSRVYMGD